jgi:hypothetical protein
MDDLVTKEQALFDECQSRYCNEDKIARLLRAGADAWWRNEEGCTPLFYAASSNAVGHYKTAQMLIRAMKTDALWQAGEKQKDMGGGQTLLHAAARWVR